MIIYHLYQDHCTQRIPFFFASLKSLKYKMSSCRCCKFQNFHNCFPLNHNIHNFNTRSNFFDIEIGLNSNNLFLINARTTHYGLKLLKVSGPKIWNTIPNLIRSNQSVVSFKHHFKKHLMASTLFILLTLFLVFLFFAIICERNFCGIYFCDFGPYSQKYLPQNYDKLCNPQKLIPQIFSYFLREIFFRGWLPNLPDITFIILGACSSAARGRKGSMTGGPDKNIIQKEKHVYP